MSEVDQVPSHELTNLDLRALLLRRKRYILTSRPSIFPLTLTQTLSGCCRNFVFVY